jgi:hypothetical protein
MKVTFKELVGTVFGATLPKEVKDFALYEGKQLQFYYLYDDSKSKIVDIKGLKTVMSISSIAFKGRPFSSGGTVYTIGGFSNIVDTQNSLLFMFLKHYAESSEEAYKELLKYFAKAKETDLVNVNEKLLSTTYKNNFEIITRGDFEDALSNYLMAPPQVVSNVQMVVDSMDAYYQKKYGKPIYGNCIERVVTAMPLPSGGLVPEKNGTFDYLYVGENSTEVKAGDETLKQAKVMLRDKYDVSEIFIKTGWYFNAKDSKWRKLIDDSNAKLKVSIPNDSVYIKSDSKFVGQEDNLFTALGGRPNQKFDNNSILSYFEKGWDVTLGDVLDHPALYKHYPSLYRMPIFFGSNTQKKQYTFFQTPVGFLVIFGNEQEFDLLTVLLHETQHAIQGIEGYSQGGTLQLANMIMTIGGEGVKKFVYLKKNMEEKYALGAVANGMYSYDKYSRFIKLFSDDKTDENSYYKNPKVSFQNILNAYLNLSYISSSERDRLRKAVTDYLGNYFVPAMQEIDALLNKASNKKSVLKNQGYSGQEIESLFFSAYETLVGEIESRDVQHTSKLEAEVKGYALPLTSERIDESITPITAIYKGMIEELPESVMGGLESVGDGKYIIHLFGDINPTPVLHELAHIIYYMFDHLNPGKIIQENILPEKIAEAGGVREAFCDLFLSYLIRQDFISQRTKRFLSEGERKLHEYPIMDVVFDMILAPKDESFEQEEEMNKILVWVKKLNESIYRDMPDVPQEPAPAKEAEVSMVNLYNIFPEPQKFVDYNGEFLYPPRAENRFRERMLPDYDKGTYIAQVKMNGSATSVTISEDYVVAKERHGTLFSVPPTFNFKAMHRGKGTMCVCGEFMNKSKKDAQGIAFKGFVIWDLTAINGKILLGSTIEERMKLVNELYPTKDVIEFDGIPFLETTEIEGIYKAINFTSDFARIYEVLTKIDMIEGLVLKRKNGRLDMMTGEKNNSGWALKVRKPTKNYEFKKGGQIIGLDDIKIEGDDKAKNKSRLEKMAKLEKAIEDKINQSGGGQIKAKIITNNNSADTIERYAKGNSGGVLQMIKGKKRFGRMLYNAIPSIDNVVSIKFFDEEKKTYADELEARTSYIVSNRHPNLWQDIADEYSFSSQKLKEFRTATAGLSHYESWSKAGEMGLPKFEGHKTTTMQSAGMPEYAQVQLKEAIENKKDWSYTWRHNYDNSVSVKLGEDGKYRGWFSQEFKDTGNGHYWLLISPTQAIFAEND